MKILYGVQGTGNGHISRASAMYEAMKHYPDLEVTWLLSGRDRELGCGAIDDFLWRKGITFVTGSGRIKILSTLAKNNLFEFCRDVKNIDLRPYDMIICDYEPVIAHAARRQGRHVTGIGHQYAFKYPIPVRGENPLVKMLMQQYAPVNQPVGLHWYHFGFPILPPILDLTVPERMPTEIENKVLVYLPFESPAEIEAITRQYPEHEFFIYHPQLQDHDDQHMHFRAISRQGFKQDLLDCSHVITNSGFELISECLHIGKRILTKPLHGQMEQLSNARALSELDYAHVIEKLKPAEIGRWLRDEQRKVQVIYPDVASKLAGWVAQGCHSSVEELSSGLWEQVRNSA